MTDEQAFLRAAQAQPDDDTLRLVYADWLEEQGEASQAAFVRLQVNRSRLDVFDPDRAALLQQEARLLQKHKRYWNGRIHRELHRRGLPGLIDARRGLIRKWDYHRGMIARVAVTADGLVEHHEVVSALGPVQALDLLGWSDWTPALVPLFAGLKAVALRWPDPTAVGWITHTRRLEAALVGMGASGLLGAVALLDLRFVSSANLAARELDVAVRAGRLPSVVLFRRTVMLPQPPPPPRFGYVQQDAHQMVHVIDPHRQWDALRLWFADFTGELLDPVRV